MSQDYYNRGGIEAFDVIEKFKLNFNLGNVIKYVLRCDKKGDKFDAVTDLVKAKEYIEREIETRRKELCETAHDDLSGLADYEARRWHG